MTPPDTAPAPELLAAIDLGSNSFHMVIARRIHGEIRTLEKMGEKVQLGAGLDERNRLTEEAQERALACLERFAQRLEGMRPDSVQVVGTNALRVARNAQQFTDRAEEILGVPVDIIAGREEARLVYLGVSHTLSDDAGRRLVVDIGGGSTEFIIGEQFEAQELDSLHMGCVSFRNRYFPDGKIKRKQMDKALTHASQELLNIRHRFIGSGWKNAVGSSGSIKAIASVVETLGLTSEGITFESLKQLREKLIDLGKVEKLSELGVKEERQSIFPAGFVILYAACESLGIERLTYADGALREGLLYDIMGRIQHEDVRERTVQALQGRYDVDRRHARAVEETAITVWREVATDWGLDNDHDEGLLRWACRLHEIGLTISHSQYHKHGAYLLRYSDLPGFSKQAQQELATLVRGHRRKFTDAVFEGCEKDELDRMKRLCVLVRLGVLLQHPRSGEQPEGVRIDVKKQKIDIGFRDGWLDERPLTRADLVSEADYLTKQGFELTF
ncbi:exopolyphosphatase [Tamilnaduibacter salinus]|nr:exopolyphosphatase [Tamilnaduibacter salinus]